MTVRKVCVIVWEAGMYVGVIVYLGLRFLMYALFWESRSNI